MSRKSGRVYALPDNYILRHFACYLLDSHASADSSGFQNCSVCIQFFLRHFDDCLRIDALEGFLSDGLGGELFGLNGDGFQLLTAGKRLFSDLCHRGRDSCLLQLLAALKCFGRFLLPLNALAATEVT